MANKTPHPHADMIIEWAKDPSRKIEVSNLHTGDHRAYFDWIEAKPPLWIDGFQYRFADEVEQKPKIVSSLTDKELCEAYWKKNVGFYTTLVDDIRPVANAAAQRAIDDLRMPDEAWFSKIQRDNGDYVMSFQYLERYLERYLNDLKEGKL